MYGCFFIDKNLLCALVLSFLSNNTKNSYNSQPTVSTVNSSDSWQRVLNQIASYAASPLDTSSLLNQQTTNDSGMWKFWLQLLHVVEDKIRSEISKMICRNHSKSLVKKKEKVVALTLSPLILSLIFLGVLL